MGLKHSHNSFSVISGAPHQQCFCPWMSPCDSRYPTVSIKSTKPSDTLVCHAIRNDQEGRVTPAHHVSAVYRR